IIVLTLVPVTRMPWITSGVAKRSVTFWFAGSTMHRGTKVNCVATMRLVIWPSAATRVPRLGSVNSSDRCSAFGSTVSILLGGLMWWTRPAYMIASMITLTTLIEIAAQRSSDLTMPSSGMATRSAHHAAGQEHEEIDQQPAQKEQAGAERGERKSAARSLADDAFEILLRRTG